MPAISFTIENTTGFVLWRHPTNNTPLLLLLATNVQKRKEGKKKGKKKGKEGKKKGREKEKKKVRKERRRVKKERKKE